MGLFDELRSKNFSLYGQVFLSHVVFSIVGWVIALILVFVEVPLCMKFCPTSPKFDSFVAFFENSWFRALMYLIFAVIMFLSSLLSTGPLIAAGVALLLAALCYGFAAFRGQAFASTSMLGGTGVDNVV
ncbi:Golgi apparatus membrane protein tvp18 [Umbelopsis nana]